MIQTTMITAPRDRDVVLTKYYGGEEAICYWDDESQLWRKRSDNSEFLGVYQWAPIPANA